MTLEKINKNFDSYLKDDAEAAKRVIRHIKNIKRKISEEDIICLAEQVILSAVMERGCTGQDILDAILLEFPRFDKNKLAELISEVVAREARKGTGPKQATLHETDEETREPDGIDKNTSDASDDVEPIVPAPDREQSSELQDILESIKQSDGELPVQDAPLIMPEDWERNKKYVCDITGLGIQGKHPEEATCGYYGMISLSDEKGKEEQSLDTPRWAWYFFGGKDRQQEFSVSENDVAQKRFKVLRPRN